MLVRRRLVIAIASFAAATLALSGLVAVPTILNVRKMVGSIAEAQRALDMRYALRSRVKSSLMSLEDSKKQLADVSAVSLSEGKELDFVNALEDAATAAGVEENIQLETANQKDVTPHERDIPVKIEVKGPFDKVIRYLGAVERLPYVLIMRSVAVRTPPGFSDQNPEGQVSLSLDGTVRWQAADSPFLDGLQ